MSHQNVDLRPPFTTLMQANNCAWAIDLQKINWKFRTGFSTPTGVSLKEHVPNNPRGGYPRGHQDTAESRDRQRPPPPSSACLLARRCAVGAAHHRVD